MAASFSTYKQPPAVSNHPPQHASSLQQFPARDSLQQQPARSSLQPESAGVGSDSHPPAILPAATPTKPEAEACHQPSAAKPVWMKKLSKQHGTYFYYNKDSKVSQWLEPAEMVTA